ncbi:MAG: STAS domain-containing protein [Gammaproteobacteria bacterium]
MGLSTHFNGSGETVVRIGERFDFSLHREFRDAYREAESGTGCYVVDLQDTDYMDSSALGMLLLLREHAGKVGSVRLVNCRPDVKRILAIANFQRLFDIQ